MRAVALRAEAVDAAEALARLHGVPPEDFIERLLLDLLRLQVAMYT